MQSNIRLSHAVRLVYVTVFFSLHLCLGIHLKAAICDVPLIISNNVACHPHFADGQNRTVGAYVSWTGGSQCTASNKRKDIYNNMSIFDIGGMSVPSDAVVSVWVCFPTGYLTDWSQLPDPANVAWKKIGQFSMLNTYNRTDGAKGYTLNYVYNDPCPWISRIEFDRATAPADGITTIQATAVRDYAPAGCGPAPVIWQLEYNSTVSPGATGRTINPQTGEISAGYVPGNIRVRATYSPCWWSSLLEVKDIQSTPCGGLSGLSPEPAWMEADDISRTLVKAVYNPSGAPPGTALDWRFDGSDLGCSMEDGPTPDSKWIRAGSISGIVNVKATVINGDKGCGVQSASTPVFIFGDEICLTKCDANSLDITIPFGPGAFGEGFAGALRLKVPQDPPPAPAPAIGDISSLVLIDGNPAVDQRLTGPNQTEKQFKAANMLCWVKPMADGSRVTFYANSQVQGSGPYTLISQNAPREREIELTRQYTGAAVTGFKVRESISGEVGAPVYEYIYSYNSNTKEWTLAFPNGEGRKVGKTTETRTATDKEVTILAGPVTDSTVHSYQKRRFEDIWGRTRQPKLFQEGVTADNHTVTTTIDYIGNNWSTGAGMEVVWKRKGGSNTDLVFRRDFYLGDRLTKQKLPWGNTQDAVEVQYFESFYPESTPLDQRKGGLTRKRLVSYPGSFITDVFRSEIRPTDNGTWYYEESADSAQAPHVPGKGKRWIRRDDLRDRLLEFRDASGNVMLRTYTSGQISGLTATALPTLIVTTKYGRVSNPANLDPATCPDLNTCALWFEIEAEEVNTTGNRLRLTRSRQEDHTTYQYFNQLATAYDSVMQRPTAFSNSDGTTEQVSGCCNLVTTTSTDQVETVEEYNWRGSLTRRTLRNVETVFSYDPAGRFSKSTRQDKLSTTSSSIPYESASYLSQGHYADFRNPLDGSTKLDGTPLGASTKIDESFNDRGEFVRSRTLPHGGQVKETFYLDGRLKEVSNESGRSVGFEYLYTADGWLTVTETVLMMSGSVLAPTAEWTKTHYNPKTGRSIQVVKPSADGSPNGSVWSRYYNDLSQLVLTIDPDGVRNVFQYDKYGSVKDLVTVASATAFAGAELNQPYSPPVDSGADRIKRTEVSYVAAGGVSPMNMDKSRRQIKRFIFLPGQSSPTLAEQTDTSLDGLKEWRAVFSSDSALAITKRETAISGSGATRVTTTTFPDLSRLIETVSYGQLITVQRVDSSGAEISKQDYSYSDSFRRLKTVTDARNGTTTFDYNNADQVTTVLFPAADSQTQPQTVSHYYDGSLREYESHYPVSIRKNTYEKGQLLKVEGGGAYPTAYTYDFQGRLATLQTFQDAVPSVTTFTYHAARNLLTERQFPDPGTGAQPPAGTHNVKYEYTQGGRLKKRTSPPDPSVTPPGAGSRLVTWYSYGFEDVPTASPRFEDVTKIEYKTESGAFNPSTGPNTTQFTPDRAGRGPSVVVFDGVTTTVTYDLQGNLKKESYAGGELNGLSVEQEPDVYLRKGSFTAKNGATVLTSATFTYDKASRLDSVSDGTYWGSYRYEPNSSLVSNFDYGTGKRTILRGTMAWDKLNRLTRLQALEDGRTAALFSRDFTYYTSDRIQTATLEDGEKWTYGYNAELGHLTSAHKTWPAAGSPLVAGQQFEYVYDNAGNRTKVRYGVDGLGADIYPATAQFNRQNQLKQRDVPAAVETLGFADQRSTLTIKRDGADTGAAERYGDYFRQRVSVNNSSSALWTGINVQADSTIKSGKVYIPKTPELIDDGATSTINEGYDADGNLKRDGRWIYTWDGQNRLISMKTRDTVAGQQSRLLKIDFGYDWRGRRISKKVYPYSSGTGDNWTASATPTLARKFVYDGWNLIAELDGANNVVRTYLWGLDLAGQKGANYADAGGIGGLIAARSVSEAHFYLQDGLGNISLTYDALRQTESSRYEYGPFGEILQTTGFWAGNNPFRYSTKYWDTESELLYFGFRYYDARLGRWLSRDPIAEGGGLNLYGYCFNDGINCVDPVGFNMFTSIGRAWNWWFNPPYNGPDYMLPSGRLRYGPLPADLDRASDKIDANDLPTAAGGRNGQMRYWADTFFGFGDELAREGIDTGLGYILPLEKGIGIFGKRLGKCRIMKNSLKAEFYAIENGWLGGRIVAKEELDRIDAILKKNGGWLKRDADQLLNKMSEEQGRKIGAWFQPLPDGRSRIVLRSDATQYEVYHELKHWADYRRLGTEEFQKIGERGIEESAAAYMKKQTWLTPEEKAHAEAYVEYIKRKYSTP